MPTLRAASSALIGALFLLAACERSPTTPPHPDPLPPAPRGGEGEAGAAPATIGTTAGTTAGPSTGTTSGATAGAVAGTTGPAQPPVPAPPVELLEAQALIPGAATALATGEQITVDPGATFRVVLKGAFPEARLSLLDGADAMVPSAGAREVGPSTTVTLQPAAPLKPGSGYRLRVDGATTRELKATDGTLRGPVELPILAAGEPPAEPKAKAKRQKRRP